MSRTQNKDNVTKLDNVRN